MLQKKDLIEIFSTRFSLLVFKKQVIHTNRLGETKPLLLQLIAELKNIEHIEHFIAKKRDRLKFYQQKW